MNYMDLVDDDAMFMFTKGQVVRMRKTLDGPLHRLRHLSRDADSTVEGEDS